MIVDVVCSRPGYIPHLVPVWEVLPEEHRGLFCAPATFSHRIPFATVNTQPRYGDCLLAGSSRDFSKDRHGVKVHLEHGIGQTYTGDGTSPHHAYPGGGQYGPYDRRDIDLFLCPSQRVADLDAPGSAVVGAPKLDAYPQPPVPKPVDDPPIVGLTWHWDGSRISPEAGTAWWEYQDRMHDLAKNWRILGHAHPAIEQNITPHYVKAGIEVTLDLGEIIRRADVLVCDNSSAQPEFAAATGRPLVFVNAQAYRRDVEHGQRFWEWPEGQIQCDRPEGLDAAIRFALDDPAPVRQAREAMVGDAYYRLDGHAADRCVEEILRCLPS